MQCSRRLAALRPSMWRLLRALLLTAGLAPLWAAAAPGQTPAVTDAQAPAVGAALTPAQAQALLTLLGDDHSRQVLVDELHAVADQAPAAATPTPPATPAAAPPATPGLPTIPGLPHPAGPAAAKAPALTPGGLGEELVGQTASWLDTLSLEITAAARAAIGVPALIHWVRVAATDPQLRARLIDAALKSLLILGAAFAVQFAGRRLALRFISTIDRAVAAAPDTGPEPDETVLGDTHVRVRALRSVRLLHRLPGALLRAVLAFLPAVAFAGVVNLLLGSGLVQLFTTKMIVLQASYAYVLFIGVTCLGRLVFTDFTPHWRLIDPGDAEAQFLDVWGRWLAGIAIFGTVLTEVGGRLGLAPAAQEGGLKLAALAVHVGVVVAIWRVRKRVARKLQPRPGMSPFWSAVASRFSQHWHLLASLLVLGSWPFWAFQQLGGTARMLRYTVATVMVLIAWRVAAIALLGLLDRGFKRSSAQRRRRADRYYPLLRQITAMLLVVLALLVLLDACGVDVFLWFAAGAIGWRLLQAVLTLAVIVALALTAWEWANAEIERSLARMTSTGHLAQAGRLRTLAPVLRSCLLAGIAVIVGLTALSEIGINTGPLLAGAGIFGVALGFGSQRLVQDFITGIFLLLENAMQVGEWVTVSGLSGTVENLSVRTIRLRAGDGSVHLIPFSSVTVVTNTNRGIGNAAVSVTVAADEDVDRVGEAIKKIGADMRADADYKSGIRSDLVFWGVDKLDGSTVTLVGQIECTDAARWGVQREFNRRVKKRFEELGIRLANTAQTVVLEQPRQAAPAWAARTRLDLMPPPAGDSATNVTLSPPPAALGHGG